jgi:hypothetical protein
MGQIQRLTRGQVKPYNSVPHIDWAHPLAQSLATYCYDIGGSIVDLVNGHRITIGANGTAPFGSQQSQFGRGLQFPLDGWGYMPPFQTGYINPFGGAAPYSAALGTIFTGLPGAASPDSGLVSVQDAANSEDTFFGFNTWPAGSTAPNPPQVACVFDNQFNAWFTPQIVAGTFQSFGVVAATTASADLYSEGLFDNTFSASTTVFNADTTAQIMYSTASINAGQTFGNGLNGFVPYFAMWGRALSAAEFLLLKEDPFCFLIYPEDDAALVGVSGGTPTLTLAATETADTAAFTTSFADGLALAVTEAADTAAFTTTFADQLSLTVTEAADIAAFTTTFSDQFTLAPTEAADTAAFTTTFGDQFALAVTEAPDVASFNLGGVISFALAVTEAPDVAAFSLGFADQFTLATSEAPDVAAFIGDDPNALSLTTTEAPDAAAFNGTFADQLALVMTEGADVAAFTTAFDDEFTLATAEAADTAAFTTSFAGIPTLTLVATESPDIGAFSVTVPDNGIVAEGGPGGGWVTRKEWKRILEEIRLEKAALAKPSKAKEAVAAVKKAAKIAAEAAEIARADEARELAVLLDSAKRADLAAVAVAKALETIAYAKALKQAAEDEQDEEEILMMLLAA